MKVTKDFIEKLICKVFKEMDEDAIYEIGDEDGGHYLKFYNGNDEGYNNIYEYGVAVSVLDEDGEFDYDSCDFDFYALERFYDTFDEFFTNGDRILSSMAEQICWDYLWGE